MVSEWRRVPLREVCKSIYRYPSFYGMEKYSQGVPVVRGEHLLNSGRISTDWKDYWFVTEEFASQFPKTRLSLDDVVMSVRGTVGQFAKVGDAHVGAQLSPNTIRISPDGEKMFPPFLYYALRSRAASSFVSGCISSSAVPALRGQDIGMIPIDLPALPEQRATACILGTLDDKIELNRRMNQTLEAMARALFKSWFVDFEPFRDRGMQDSALGEIPVGWRLGELGQICELRMGQSPPGDTYNETGEGIAFYQGIKDFGFRFPRRRVYCTMPTRFAEPNDVLLSVRAPVGRLNAANEKCAIGRGLAALRSNEGHQSYLYYLLDNAKNRWDTFNSEGTVFGCITRTNIADSKIVIPHVAVVERFQSMVGAMDDLIENNEQESHILTIIRDTLLPKLLSGEIRANDAERLLREAI
jgi:type I restriction enzyme S subunit